MQSPISQGTDHYLINKKCCILKHLQHGVAQIIHYHLTNYQLKLSLLSIINYFDAEKPDWQRFVLF